MNIFSNRRVSVIVPAYNEEAVIGDLVRKIRQVNSAFEVIVVDDGSQDGTSDQAEKAGAKVIRHPYNAGNGVSLKDGARASSGDLIVFMDGDGQHPAEEIPRLLEHLGAYDMVVGARTGQSRVSRIRTLGNWMLIGLAQWVARRKINDLTSGFRAIKREHLMRYIHLFPNRYSSPTTITLAMMLGGHFVKYVPVDSIKRREQGKSHIRPIRDFFNFLNIMIRIIMLFSPQRFFLPLGGAVFLSGLVTGVYQYLHTGGIQGTTVTLIVTSVYILCFGLLADQIALLRREKTL